MTHTTSDGKVLHKALSSALNLIKNYFDCPLSMRRFLTLKYTSVAFIITAAATPASWATVTVNGTDAIFLAGRTDLTLAPPGAPPSGYPLVRNSPAGPSSETFPEQISVFPGESFQFSGSGTVNYATISGGATYGIDGQGAPNPDLDPVAGISGYSGPLGLVGVFLTDQDPQNSVPPSKINFAPFSTLSPGLNQVFFIGDGLTGTGTGTVQTFIPPTGATRLFLGTVDGLQFSGTPGAYDDNAGSFAVAVNMVPEPTVPLAFFCVAAFITSSRRRFAAGRTAF